MQEQREGAGEAVGMRSEHKQLAAWNIIERKAGEKPIWHRVGIGFVNRDGSINVLLDSIPLQGKIQLRDDTDARDGAQTWSRRPRPPPPPLGDAE